MTLIELPDLSQGSEEWLEARRGMVTASVVGKLVTSRTPSGLAYQCPECGAPAESPCVSRARRDAAPIKTLHGSRVAPDDAPAVIEPANNDESSALTALLVAERITGYIDPVYVTNDMLRGQMDEPLARAKYAEHFGVKVRESGFLIRDDWGFRIGYSPDGLVGEDGLIEVKAPRAKTHVRTILADEVPAHHMAQIQCGLLVSGREWCDFLSYSGGLPMWPKRVHPDQRWFDAIVAAVEQFEQTAAEMVARYEAAVVGLPMTERVNFDAEIQVAA